MKKRKTQMMLFDIPEDTVVLHMIADCYRDGKVVREGIKIGASELVDILNNTNAFMDYVDDLEDELNAIEDELDALTGDDDEEDEEDEPEEDECVEEIVEIEEIEGKKEETVHEVEMTTEELKEAVDILLHLLKGIKEC